MIDRVFIKTSAKEIPGIYTYPDGTASRVPSALMIHGFMAYKEGDGFLLTKLAERLAGIGFASLRIDCTSMGENRNDRRDYDMPHLLADVAAGYRHMQANPRLDHDRIGLIGHSLGGRLVALSAGLDPAFVVTLNGAVGTMGVASRYEWNDQGYTVVATSDGRHELLYRTFFDSQAGHDVDQAMSGYRGPVAVCYGQADPTVDPQASVGFFDRLADRDKVLIGIPQANHTFNAKTGDYTKVGELADRLCAWLAGLYTVD